MHGQMSYIYIYNIYIYIYIYIYVRTHLSLIQSIIYVVQYNNFLWDCCSIIQNFFQTSTSDGDLACSRALYRFGVYIFSNI